MAQSWRYQTPAMTSAQNNLYIPAGRESHLSYAQRGRHNRIFKTTSADNSPTKFSRRDRTRDGNVRQRLARSCLVEDTFHAALLRNLHAEQTVPNLPAASADNSYYPGIGVPWESNGMPERCDGATTTSFSQDLQDSSALQQYILRLNEQLSYQPPNPQIQPQVTGPYYPIDYVSTASSAPGLMPTTAYDTSSVPNYGYSWPNDTYQTSTMPSAFTSPDMIATQSSFEEPKTPPPISSEPGDELVAVGLYDDPISGWDQLTNGYLGTELSGSFDQTNRPAGKGLKLEETFEPAATDEEENDDQEAQEDNEEEENPKELEGPSESTTVPTDPKQMQQDDLAQQVAMIQHQLDMVNKTFLFDNEQDPSSRMSKATGAMDLSGNMYMGSYGMGY